MIRKNDTEFLHTEYLINGVPFSDFGIDVIAKRGLFDLLRVKERTSVSLPGQHGVVMDRTGCLYEPRSMEFDLSFSDGRNPSREKVALFRSQFIGSAPSRLTMREDYREYVWDVDWSEELNREYLRWYAEQNTITLLETAPVKAVYQVVGASASFATAPLSGEVQEPLLFSWGDNSFTDSVRTATTTHTYTDDYDKHLVIISGVLSAVKITTNHELKYTVAY